MTIYIGCSTCSAANDPSISAVLQEYVSKIDSIANVLDIPAYSLGISNEISINEGIEHLASIYTFDEIAIGNGLSNIGLQKYLWGSLKIISDPVIPQFLVVIREYASVSNSYLDFTKRIKNEEVLEKSQGVIELYENLDSKTYEIILNNSRQFMLQ